MLTKSQITYLRSLAHSKKPVVQIGNKGVTDEVLKEITTSLEHHELMKIKVAGLNRDNQEEVAGELSSRCHAETVQILGKIITLFRQREKNSAITLPRD